MGLYQPWKNLDPYPHWLGLSFYYCGAAVGCGAGNMVLAEH